jgi:hypothetical protein
MSILWKHFQSMTVDFEKALKYYKASEPSPHSVLSFDLDDHYLISCNRAILRLDYPLTPRRSVRYSS